MIASPRPASRRLRLTKETSMAKQQSARFQVTDEEAQKIGDVVTKICGSPVEGLVSMSLQVRPENNSVVTIDYAQA